MMKRCLITLTVTTLLVNTLFAATYSSGHGDIGLGEGSKLELHLHLHEGAVVNGSVLTEDTEYEPDEVAIRVPYSTLFSRPADSAWNLIGNNAGENTWAFPASRSDAESQNAPYLGIGAEEVQLGAFADDTITLTLVDVTGPGFFSLYSLSLGEPTFYMSSYDGITAADSIHLDLTAGKHADYNFGFSEAGPYQITFEASAVDASTGQTVTDTGTFTFHVIPEPTTFALLAFASIAVLRRRR